MSNKAESVNNNNKEQNNKAQNNKEQNNKAQNNKAQNNKAQNNKNTRSKTKKAKGKKGNKKSNLMKKEIMRLKLNYDDLEMKHNKLKKMYAKLGEQNKKQTQKIKRMLSSSDKIVPSLKDLKNNILVAYQTFEQLNTLLGNIYLEKEKPPAPPKKKL